MRRRHVRRSGYRSRDYFAQRDNSRRGRSGFSRNTWRFQGGARWLQADSVAFRPGHRRQRRATGEPHSIDRALLRRLSNATSAGEHRGFASRHIALKSDLMPLYTDVVNSTTLTQSLGDEVALAILGVHDTIVRDALSALGGREVKHTGDGIMACFISTAGAVRCAIQIQRELDKHAQANPDRQLKVRVGAAAGEPVEQHNDLFGSTVQLAARLCAHAQPEQILVSNAIAELCLGKGLLFDDLGEVSLKGFGSPVRAHAVHWTGEALQTAV